MTVEYGGFHFVPALICPSTGVDPAPHIKKFTLIVREIKLCP